MKRTPSPAIAMSFVLTAVFIAWTWLVRRTGLLDAWDASALTPAVDPISIPGQLFTALAVVTWPGVTYAAVLAIALWAQHRRLRNLAVALLLSVVLSWGGNHLLKQLFRRARPTEAVPVFTAEGWSYPSGHMAAIVTLAVMALAAITISRHRPVFLWTSRAIAAVTILLVALDRWALRAHYPTDIVAGMLWGALAAALSLAIAGVHVPRPWTGRARADAHAGPARLAIIVNPTKVNDWATFRAQVNGAAHEYNWPAPTWLETTVDDAGVEMTRLARKMKADLVLVAGGDGTVRTVCAGLAGSGIPLAVLPAGTGNLLARNLGIPLDAADALEVAFTGRPQLIDLVRTRLDDSPHDHYSAVMAGMGADAAIMLDTNSDLKRVVGHAAYAVAAVQAATRPPFQVRVDVDGEEMLDGTAAMALIANVGQITGGIVMVPDAQADDGRLDVLIASPQRPADWVTMAGRVVTRLGDAGGVRRRQGRRVSIRTEEPVPFQIDGDPIAECTRVEGYIEPDALSVMVP
ncbi:diacylglycerol kinase family protein [Nigerium massiliense]|uniref:diacylglycerol kinase family protein n=1 Tax=Nigerium massiliense TaxID=1522317 RepID=UPI000694DCD4|nr:diacylglycerol kinase family protein [Nigerium massiliense]